MTSTTTAAIIEKLHVQFAQFGIPDVLVSNNGTNPVSKEFAEFTQHNGIKHVTSAPAHSSSKGLAEHVHTFKNGLSRMREGSIITKPSHFLSFPTGTPSGNHWIDTGRTFDGEEVMVGIKPDLENEW